MHLQVFRQIELPAELRRLERLRARLRTQRSRFIESISNNTDVFNLHTLVRNRWCRTTNISSFITVHDTRYLPGEREIARLWRSGPGSGGGGSPGQLRDGYCWSGRLLRIGIATHRDGEMERSPGGFLRQHRPHDDRYSALIINKESINKFRQPDVQN